MASMSKVEHGLKGRLTEFPPRFCVLHIHLRSFVYHDIHKLVESLSKTRMNERAYSRSRDTEKIKRMRAASTCTTGNVAPSFNAAGKRCREDAQ
jgi:hypothetical protein